MTQEPSEGVSMFGSLSFYFLGWDVTGSYNFKQDPECS